MAEGLDDALQRVKRNLAAVTPNSQDAKDLVATARTQLAHAKTQKEIDDAEELLALAKMF